MRKAVKWILGAALLCALPACKKEEQTTTLPSLSGLYITEAVPYVLEGDDVTIKAHVTDISTSDGKDPGVLGLYWQVNTAKRDTVSTDISKSVPDLNYHVDTLGTYVVYGYVYAAGYYNSSANTTFQAIVPELSLTGLDGTEDTPAGLVLVRSVIIGDDIWMAQNLYGTLTGSCYKNALAVAEPFGQYYSWEEALTACPEGWHLPTGAEFDALGTSAQALMAPACFLEKEMWVTAQGITPTNESGFNAIPVGYLDKTASSGQEHGYGQYALFWTADEEDTELASYRYIRYDQDTVNKGKGHKKSLALSVRCVMD